MIVSSAIQRKSDGKIWTGKRHGDCIRQIVEETGQRPVDRYRYKEGERKMKKEIEKIIEECINKFISDPERCSIPEFADRIYNIPAGVMQEEKCSYVSKWTIGEIRKLVCEKQCNQTPTLCGDTGIIPHVLTAGELPEAYIKLKKDLDIKNKALLGIKDMMVQYLATFIKKEGKEGK